MALHKTQKAQLKVLVTSPYYVSLRDLITEMITETNSDSTVGRTTFETVSLSLRREARLEVLRELQERIERYASEV